MRRTTREAIGKSVAERWRDESTGFRELMCSGLKRRWRTKRYRKMMSKILRKKWKDPKYRAKMKKRVPNIVRVRTSKPQISLFKRICRAGHKGFRLEYRVGRFIIDIAHPRRKIAIEVDGIYWHKLRRKTDRRKDRFLGSLGWRVIRVSEKNVRTVSVSF